MSHAAPPPPPSSAPPPPPYICGTCHTPGPGAGACATCGASNWLVATYPPPSPAPSHAMPPAQWGGQPGYRMTRQATFGEAVNDALKARYATFEGRSSRSQYWWFELFYLAVSFAALFVLIIGYAISDTLGTIAVILYLVLILALIVPGISVLVRRLHDTDRSGWWFWISLIPFGSLVLFVFTVLDGTSGSNRYGERPGPYAG